MVRVLHAIINKVWREEVTPTDWAKMVVSPVYKKGDPLDPENYRAIALLSIPGKVFWRVIGERMKPRIEEVLSKRQFAFRPGRGTTDAIFVVRQMVEKAREKEKHFHFNYVDFKAAFYTIWRKALWRMLEAIGIERKIVRIIKECYDKTQCSITVDGDLTKWFPVGVGVGVRQGCSVSPSLFNVYLEFVMEELESANNYFGYSEDLVTEIRYGDDTTLIAGGIEQQRVVTEELEQACRRWGLKINAGKSKTMSPSNEVIAIDNEDLEHVEEFTFLGSVVPGSESNIKWTALAAAAFGRLRRTVWNRRDVSRRLKIILYKAL
ncbi:hypothetical protein Pcinc_029177, partial [Petrolisthes cinctipes]